jgi:hypothetical protein
MPKQVEKAVPMREVKQAADANGSLSCLEFPRPSPRVSVRWERLTTARAEVAWSVETLTGSPQGELIAAWFGPGSAGGQRRVTVQSVTGCRFR